MDTNPDYSALLETAEWKELREAIISRDRGKCRHCGKTTNLHVHHRQYHFNSRTNEFVKPWSYPSNLLVTLCSICHMNGHKEFNIPTFKI
jgi:5-methylcytosine-specific restriction endonuclease McrA